MSVLLITGRNVRWPRRMLPLVSNVEYAPRAQLRLEKDGTDRRTDGRTPDRCITFTARRAASV